MRVRRELQYRAEAGSLEVTVEYTDRGEPSGVYVESAQDRNALQDTVVPLELLERLAILCRSIRAQEGDQRPVCADHGYYEPVEHERDEPECPGCLVEVRAKDGAARARAAGDV